MKTPATVFLGAILLLATAPAFAVQGELTPQRALGPPHRSRETQSAKCLAHIDQCALPKRDGPRLRGGGYRNHKGWQR